MYNNNVYVCVYAICEFKDPINMKQDCPDSLWILTPFSILLIPHPQDELEKKNTSG